MMENCLTCSRSHKVDCDTIWCMHPAREKERTSFMYTSDGVVVCGFEDDGDIIPFHGCPFHIRAVADSEVKG